MNNEPIIEKEAEGLRFHVESDDTFATMATVINLLYVEKPEHKKVRYGIVKQLMHLQKNYIIMPKSYFTVDKAEEDSYTNYLTSDKN